MNPLFSVPPPTRLDLKFSILGFPIRVHPLFWLMAILFGRGLSLPQMLVWIGVIFVSILVHELGHSLAMRRYGLDSKIILHMMGGLAVPEVGSNSNQWKRATSNPLNWVIVSLAGPFAGFAFAAAVYAIVVAMGGTVGINWLFNIIPIPELIYFPGQNWIARSLIRHLFWINTFWGILNLLPVHPLDGGQVARGLFLKANPLNGVRYSLWLSVITGVGLAVAGFFLLNSTYMGLLFGYLAFQSYQQVKRVSI